MAKVLNDTFGIAEGVINTVHAYTNDQRLADVPHSDWRRSRAAAENIIPTSTGAAKAVGEVLPISQGGYTALPQGSPCRRISGRSVRRAETAVTAEDIHQAVRSAASTPALAGILEYSDVPIVSSDIIGNAHSSIYDSGFTAVSQNATYERSTGTTTNGGTKSSLRSARRHRPLVIQSPNHLTSRIAGAARMLLTGAYRFDCYTKRRMVWAACSLPRRFATLQGELWHYLSDRPSLKSLQH